jgi:hypothetical protein
MVHSLTRPCMRSYAEEVKWRHRFPIAGWGQVVKIYTMIMEAIPAVKRLTPEEKVILAGELYRAALDDAPTTADADIRKWLGAQWRKYLKNPDEVKSWDVVKQNLRRTVGVSVSVRVSL